MSSIPRRVVILTLLSFNWVHASTPTPQPTFDGNLSEYTPNVLQLGQEETQGVPWYCLTDLGTLGGVGSYAQDLSNSGIVVGAAQVADGSYHAFTWSNGHVTDLTPALVGNAIGYAANNQGIVAGLLYDGLNHAVYWQRGIQFDISHPAYVFSRATNINEIGEIVGYYHTGTTWRSFIWLPTSNYGLPAGRTELPTLGGSATIAFGINNNGKVVGWGRNAAEKARAWQWQSGLIAELSTLSGDSVAYSINDVGQIVGASNIATGDRHACMWFESDITDLTPLDTYHASAWNINNLGQIVGDVIPFVSANPYAALFTVNEVIDLNTRVSEGEDWHLTRAWGINDNGWIVGEGFVYEGQTHGFLLTPMSDTCVFGGCCEIDGSCSYTTESNCLFGRWLIGGNCVPNTCPQPGECCRSDGSCTVSLSTACTDGEWTEGGTCSLNQCPQPGRCCPGDGTCTFQLQATCTGTWEEGGSCTSNPCPATPTLAAAGCRYLSVNPNMPGTDEPFALRATSAELPCIDLFVSDEGLLTTTPTFKTAAEWGSMYVADQETVPGKSYTIQAINGSFVSGTATVTTWHFGDTNNDSIIDLDDILCVLAAFSGNYSPTCTLYSADQIGGFFNPDRIVNLDDILAVLNAFAGQPYPGPHPCP